MSTTSPLFETMSAQIEAECGEHRAAAQAEADRIASEARAKADAARTAALAAAQAERDRLDSLWRQKGEAERIRLELAMKNDAVEAVLAEARAEIARAVASPEFGDVLDKLLAELMEEAPESGDLKVLAPPKYTDRVSSWLSENGRAGVDVEASQAFEDGVAVQDPGRTFRISNTLSGRFELMEQDIRKQCMTTLFDGGGAA